MLVISRLSIVRIVSGAGTSVSFDETLGKLQDAEQRLADAAQRYPRVVLWTEHDSYDQLALTRWLALFDRTAKEMFAPGEAALLSERAHRIGDSLRSGLFFGPGAT